MSNEHVNNNQQAQNKPTRKAIAAKWLWRAVRAADILCRWLEKFEAGE
ncbi:hypothetical protein [Grimontia hollisae]|nr:hypothetical protein [Grimontia hollisae]